MPIMIWSPKRSGKEWSVNDLNRMRRLAKRGYSSTEAAAELGRTPNATRYAACKRNIRFKSLGASHSRKQRLRWK